MKKQKVKDIIKTSRAEKINLRGSVSDKNKPLTKNKNILFKQETPIKEVKDLDGGPSQNYIYIKGTKFTPPKYLGNALRIAVAGLAILLIINVINVYFIGKRLQDDISAKAYEGYNFLIDAGKNATKIQFDSALASFENAEKTFKEASTELWFINTDESFYSKNNSVGQAVQALLESGKYFATAGKYFLDAIEEFNSLPLYFVSKNTDKNTPSITDSLKIGLTNTDLAIEQITLAAEKIETVDEETLPPQLQSKISFAKKKVQEISDILSSTSTHFPALLKLLGDRYPHRYLILFQNNNEIRPTGGFIGSYAIVDINEGYIEKLETHDVYDIDGSYHQIIEPPEEFLAFTSNWRFRDSNYSPDFAISAAKARWFLEKEGGPTADTVIAINQGLLKDMLEITGPIQVGNFGKLDSNNYNLLLSYIIEGKVWGPEDPKHILKVFVPIFKEAILKEENLSKIMSKLYKAIQQKHIVFYSSDQDIQALFNATGISGTTYQNEENEDYLSVVNIATGGTKSEQFMEESITHHTFIDEYGGLTDEIKITRTHNWTDDIYIQWKKTLSAYGFEEMPDQLIDILGRGPNKVSTRIYVPEGSKLLESDGADVMTKFDNDLNKTYFFFTSDTSAGETSEIYIKYKLPMKLDFSPADTYKLIVEKQLGSRGSIFTKTLSAADSLKNLGTYPDDTLTYATNLVYDKYFSSIWTK